MGCPEVLITDQGREFINVLSDELFHITKTKHRITSAYHPQTNGLTERFNQTLTRCLSKVVDESQSDWDEKIDTVLMGYRASQQASTKCSPYFMLFQKNMRLPIDNEVLPYTPFNEEEDISKRDVSEIIDCLMHSREVVFGSASANIKRAQKNQKETYDRKHKPSVFKIGSKVLLENTAQKQRKGGKMDPLWLGPYVITRDLGKGIYELSSLKGRVIKNKVNVHRLKRYVKRLQDSGCNVDQPLYETPKGKVKKGKRKRHENNEHPPQKWKVKNSILGLCIAGKSWLLL